MKKTHILLSLTALLALAACGKQDLTEKATFKIFTAGMDEKTTIDADGKSVVWEGGEQLAIYSGAATARNKFTTASTGAVATFTGTAPDADTYYAVYPYDAAYAHNSEKVFRIEMPHTFRAVKDGLAVDANPDGGSAVFSANPTIGVATALDMNISMRNICCLLKFTISRSDVRLVVFRFGDNYFGGRRDVTLDGDNVPSTTTGVTGTARARAVAILPPAGESAFEPGDYYVTCWPIASAQKPAVVVLCEGKNFFQKTGATTVQPVRNGSINFGTIDSGEPSTMSHLDQTFTIDFTKASNAIFYKGSGGTVMALPNEYATDEPTYYYNDSKNYPFKIRGADKGYRHTAIGGKNALELVAGDEATSTTKTGRITFPPLGTRRLQKVTLTLYMPAGAPDQRIRLSDTGGNAGELATVLFEAPAEGGEVTKTINVPNAGYYCGYILCSKVPGCYIRNLSLYYNTEYSND